MSVEGIITQTLRRDGWTCEYHEPVSDAGECSECDDLHRRTAERVTQALTAGGYRMFHESEISQEWGLRAYGSNRVDFLNEDRDEVRAIEDGFPFSELVERDVLPWVPDRHRDRGAAVSQQGETP